MSADTLRRAAALMRERAEAAEQPTDGPGWIVDRVDRFASPREVFTGPLGADSSDVATATDAATATHIASWHPAVARVVAKAMDDVAHAWEICDDGWTYDLDNDPIRFEDTVDGGWLAVARAYLGEAS